MRKGVFDQVCRNWRNIGDGVARDLEHPAFYGCWECCLVASESGQPYTSQARTIQAIKTHMATEHGPAKQNNKTSGNAAAAIAPNVNNKNTTTSINKVSNSNTNRPPPIVHPSNFNNTSIEQDSNNNIRENSRNANNNNNAQNFVHPDKELRDIEYDAEGNERNADNDGNNNNINGNFVKSTGILKSPFLNVTDNNNNNDTRNSVLQYVQNENDDDAETRQYELQRQKDANNNNSAAGDEDISRNDNDVDGGSMSGDSGEHLSHGSGSGGSGTSNGNATKSTLPCGMSMTIIMMLLLLVPIIFLSVITAMPMDSSIRAQRLLSAHRETIEDILAVGQTVQLDRGAVSTFLSTAANSTRAAAAAKDMANYRGQIDSLVDKILRDMQRSDLANSVDLIMELQKLFQRLLLFRQQIDNRQITGPDARMLFVLIIDEFYGLIMWIAKDPRAQALESRIFVLFLIRKAANSFGVTRSVGAGLLGDEGLDRANINMLAAMKSGVERDILLIEQTGEQEAVNFARMYRSHPYQNDYWAMASKFLAGNRTHFLATVNETTWLDYGITIFFAMNAGNKEPIAVITDGSLLQKVSLENGMKMMGAILACIIIAGLAIYYNRREGARLQKALDATTVMAVAVRRFVPKNQLRTMGVRGITQVHPNMNTEVAQTIIYSSLRGFDPESMPLNALFEWLARYVERMASVVAEEKSYISNFIGDALMIIAAQPTNGVSACIKMGIAIDTLNIETNASGTGHQIHACMGVNYGVAVAAMMGDENRLSATIIGSDVNLAEKLSFLCDKYSAKILASESVVANISDELFPNIRCVGYVQVSGKPVAIYDIYANDERKVKEYKLETQDKLEEAIELHERDPKSAAKIFDHVHRVAQENAVQDKAVELRASPASTPRRHTVAAKGGGSGVVHYYDAGRNTLDYSTNGENPSGESTRNSLGRTNKNHDEAATPPMPQFVYTQQETQIEPERRHGTKSPVMTRSVLAPLQLPSFHQPHQEQQQPQKQQQQQHVAYPCFSAVSRESLHSTNQSLPLPVVQEFHDE